MKTKGKEIRVLGVKPHEHLGAYMLESTLEVMQEAVRGYIDIMGLDDSIYVLLNGEGKLIDLEGSRKIGSDIIVGNFPTCDSDEEGNLVSLSEEALDTCTKISYGPQEFAKEKMEETTIIEFYTFE